MRMRKRYLPAGWYPDSAEQTRGAIERMARSFPAGARNGSAGVVPHAGWEFSGSLALEVFSLMCPDIDTMLIIGGHLGPADGILCAFEDAYDTPLGPISADLELLEQIRAMIPVREDRYADNTVEVQLPFIRHLFPRARALGMRAAPSRDAEKLGIAIAKAAKTLGRRVAVAGSTDLTHYGSSYGFEPRGSGERARAWVRDVNDRAFIDCLLKLDFGAALEHALREHSACSAGGALAALAFAERAGAKAGRLLKYATSYEVHPAPSFVGYAGILYP
jgi:AmmeMemoRadiSam system protein B